MQNEELLLAGCDVARLDLCEPPCLLVFNMLSILIISKRVD